MKKKCVECDKRFDASSRGNRAITCSVECGDDRMRRKASREYAPRYFKKYPDKVRAQRRRWAKENPEKIRKYYETQINRNPDRYRALKKKVHDRYRKRNAAKIAERRRMERLKDRIFRELLLELHPELVAL